MTDWQILDQFIADDHSAFEKLVGRHAGWIHRLAQRQLHDASLADDVTQAVFLVLIRKARSLRRSTPLAGWLYRVAMLATKEIARSEARKKKREEMAAMMRPEQASSEDSSWTALAPLLDSAVAGLSKSDRQAVVLRFYSQKEFADIAAELNTTEAAARKRIERAVGKLRNVFAMAGINLTPLVLSDTLFSQVGGAPGDALLSRILQTRAFASNPIASRILRRLAGAKWLSLSAAVIGLLVVVTALHGLVHPNDSVPGASNSSVDPAALVHEVRQADHWLDTAESLHLIIESSYRLEMAFDRHRLFRREDLTNGTTNIGIWDGKQAVMYEKYPNQEGFYGLDRDPYTYIGRIYNGYFPWLRAGPHNYWWISTHEPTDERFYGYPEDYRLTGQQTFHGHVCYVLDTDFYYRTLYVGVADHKLYGTEQRVFSSVGNQGKREQVIADLVKEFGGRRDNVNQFWPWYAKLSPPRQHQFDLERFKRLRSLSRPYFSFWFDDYRQIAPGCWMPMTIGTEFWNPNANPPKITNRIEQKVVLAEKDMPLPASLFTMQIEEGHQVNDWGHDPPLFYKYKKNMTTAAWNRILSEAEQRKRGEEIRQSSEDARIGKPAPPFAPKQWLNSKPLAWTDLKGRIVILDFWSLGCGPCRNDFPTAKQINKDRAQTGIVVIGVHAADGKVEDIQNFMRQFDMAYPVCIDKQVPDGIGETFAKYGVSAMPDSFLIDAHGTVIAHGPIAAMAARAKALAAVGGS
jgi:RNA polymerase sigma factor (sigma-70 family)